MTRTNQLYIPTVSKKVAQTLMNEFGKHREAFFFMIDFEMKRPIVLSAKQMQHYPIWWEINGHRNYQATLNNQIEKTIELKKEPITKSQYQDAFDLVQRAINHGNSYLLNLTFPTPIHINLSLADIFKQSSAKYKLLLNEDLVLFSPETFIQIKESQIASFPMKGTIDANIPNAKELILADPKEKAEHCTIVDLIRNDMNLVATNVQVEQFRYIDTLKTAQKELLQVSSKITGDLPVNYHKHLGDLLMRLLPAGSISGAPKKKTVEIIQEAEGQARGYYTGVFGYFDGTNLDSGVMIRYIENIKGQLFYRSGGGITTSSICDKEYQELLDKVYVPIY